jgi:GNAT superfamily N-acetyltransferase
MNALSNGSRVNAASVKIRLADPGELGLLVEIERRAESLFPPGKIPQGDGAASCSYLDAACTAGLLFVAQLGSSPVGYACCQEHELLLHLEELSVDPDFGRRGIGRQLVQHVLDLAGRLEFAGVTLTTFSDLPFNGPFYESMGFRALLPPELPETLAAILEDEARRGLMNRVAMRYDAATTC